jgi:radical SAM protein with 4Fe4S-binding SPASM domain
MSEDTFKKIIDELAELQFGGIIYYHSNNEPFIDGRIIDFIKYGSSKVLNAKHWLYTNGTLLDNKKFQSIVESGLNYLRINNYNDNLKLNPNIKEIYDEYKNKEFSLQCEIRLRLKNEVLSTRGGSAPNRKIKETLNASCYFPFSYLVVRANCGVSLCCNDALGKVTLGNVEEQTLEEIWFGKKHFDLLNSIRKNMRNDIEICRECDMIPAKNHCITWGINPKFFNKIIK